MTATLSKPITCAPAVRLALRDPRSSEITMDAVDDGARTANDVLEWAINDRRHIQPSAADYALQELEGHGIYGLLAFIEGVVILDADRDAVRLVEGLFDIAQVLSEGGAA